MDDQTTLESRVLTRPIAITPQTAANRWGNSPRWWKVWLPKLVEDGLAGKRGSSFFVRPQLVDAWLMNEKEGQ